MSDKQNPTPWAQVDKRRVLIVAGEEDFAASLKVFLESNQYEVALARANKEALETIETFPAHVALLDIQFGSESEINLVSQVKKSRPDVLCVVIARFSSIDISIKALRQGAYDYLLRPFGLDDLSATLDRCFEKIELEKAKIDAEMTRLESDYRFRAVVDSVADAIITINDRGTVESFNPAAERTFGYAAWEVIGENVSVLMPEPYRGEHDRYLQNYLRTGKAKIIGIGREVTGLRKDGSTFPIELAISEMRIGGRPLFIGIARDITERKRAEELFRESERRLELALDAANGGVWDWNLKTNDVVFTPRWLATFGYSPGDLAPHLDSWKNLIHPDDMPRIMEALDAHFKGQAPFYECEYRILAKSGEWRWSHDRGMAVTRDAGGNPLRMVGIDVDVTEHKKAEESIHANEERLKLALEGSADGLWDWNVKTGEVYYSPRWMTMLGYEPFELEGRVRTWENLVHPDDMPETMRVLNDHLQNRTPQYEAVNRMRTKSGEWKWILARGKVWERDSDGKPVRITGTHTDISDRKRIEEELFRASQAKSEFLSRMSHELRTPLNAILGFSQLLQSDREQPLTEPQTENVKEILKAGDHLLNLIDEILDLARIEAGKISLSLEQVSVAEAVDEALVLIKPMAKQMGIYLVNNVAEPAGHAALADRVRLKQVLLNLLSNAVKYNREGGSATLEGLETPGGKYRLSVIDTGPGIPEEQHAKVFEPFNRLDAERSGVPGTGIGLTISKRLMELMGGSIGLKNARGQGTEFFIELPLVEKTVPKKEKAETVFSRERGNTNTDRQWTLLYVEDDEANRTLVQHILRRRPNVKMILAPQAQMGIDLARAHRPDAILLDIHLPEMDGFTALKHLKTYEETRNIPVIAFSASAMESDIQRGLSAGFIRYITKPIRIDDFLQTLDDTFRLLAGPGGVNSGRRA